MLGIKKYLADFDYSILVSMLILIGVGLAAIYSATYQAESAWLKDNFTRQLWWSGIGILALGLVVLIPIRFYSFFSYWIFLFTIGLLFILLFVGSGKGASRWLLLGPIRFQPSEFAKIGVLLALSRFLSEERRDLRRIKDILIAFGFVGLPMLLVMQQPDLGTAMVFAAIILPILFWAGLSPFIIFVMVAPFLTLISAFNFYTFFLTMLVITTVLILSKKGLRTFLINFLLNVSVGIITPFVWGKLHTYQQRRILTFLGLENDPHGFSYQVIQSQVAIGSGGFLGKGFCKGTQTQLRFLPAQHTDFIFSVIGEEFGFVGAFLVLSLFLFILLKGIRIASIAKNRYASLLVIGVVTILAFHVIVNVGMTIGMMPVTGIPLPFLSYGGSALVANMILVGLLLNVSMRRYEY